MKKKISMDRPASYCIKISGMLDEKWFAYYDNMVLGKEESDDLLPMTTLTGSVPDQAALIGMLTLLYDMRFPLISVEFISDNPIN